jgi:hypothetical protein
MGLGSLSVDELVAMDPGELADRDTIVDLMVQLARLDAVVARAAARVDTGR